MDGRCLSTELKKVNYFVMPWYQKAHRTTGVPPGAPVALALRSLGYHGIIEELPCQDRFYVVLQTCYGWKTVVYWTKESQLFHHAMMSKGSQNHGRATWRSCCISTLEFRTSWRYWRATFILHGCTYIYLIYIFKFKILLLRIVCWLHRLTCNKIMITLETYTVVLSLHVYSISLDFIFFLV